MDDTKSPVTELNELEFFEGKLLVNVWMANYVLKVNPEDGKVEWFFYINFRTYDFTHLVYKILIIFNLISLRSMKLDQVNYISSDHI